jgi:Uncharacterized conserved protein (DUF2163)
MRSVTGGNYQDTTSAVQAYLAANTELWMANLYLIGPPEHPQALRLTDWESPLWWIPGGKFLPAAGITRGKITSKIGLDVASLDLTWSPANRTFTQNLSTSSPLQLAQLGFYDNWPVRVWRLYMPTPGDANTLGAMALFGGRIAQTSVDRAQIKWTVNSWLDVVNQQVPSTVIENTNTMSGFAGAVPPYGFNFIPQFQVVEAVDTNIVVAACTGPQDAGRIFSYNAFYQAALVFNNGPNSTLGGLWAIIGQSEPWPGYPSPPPGGYTANQFNLYGNLPWPPTANDTFFVSSPPLVDSADQASGLFYGFPYVPSPETAV